jgi:GH15 family glucan-1,4-alpha-glucosidase
MTDDWQQGDVEYKGQHYEDLALLYDITTDKLVSELFNGQPFVLVKEHLKRFSIGGRNFIKVQTDSIYNDLPAQGFYEEVYGGNTQVLVRHVKVKEERIENAVLQIYFSPKSRHYILHGGHYERVTNKSSVLKVLKDHKAEVRSFIKKEKLKFSSATLSQALASVASYYDTLKPVVK